MSTDDSRAEKPTDDRPRTADRTRSYCELGEAIDALERVDLLEVPTFSTSEAAALHARLQEARDALGDQMSPAPAGEGL